MPTPRSSSAYPPALLAALAHVQATGELKIPTGKPAALRLQFHGLFGALRKEGKSELCEGIGCYLSEGMLILAMKDSTSMGIDVLNALTAATGKEFSPPSLDADEAALDRILSGGKS